MAHLRQYQWRHYHPAPLLRLVVGAKRIQPFVECSNGLFLGDQPQTEDLFSARLIIITTLYHLRPMTACLISRLSKLSSLFFATPTSCSMNVSTFIDTSSSRNVFRKSSTLELALVALLQEVTTRKLVPRMLYDQRAPQWRS
mmetsp:Transcript_24487/g.41928  ORF Transcript_24487/g.41928 Transcript_24487/m.41928 type:complete len:142 (+) Transcript_24487:385-810(+)